MNQKMICIAIGIACFCLGAKAQQHVSFGPLHSADSPREDWILPGDTIFEAGIAKIYNGKPLKNSAVTLEKPNMALEKKAMELEPFEYGGLHKGLNFSVDLSAFATFGKYAPHKGGFTQTIDATYLTPLTKDNKFWMALGGYVSHVNYGGDSYHDGGIYGVLGYKLDEHWEAYVYGQLSISNNYNSLYGRYAGYGPYGYGWGMYPWGLGSRLMPGGYGVGMPGANVLGAGIKYTNTRKTFSIGLSVESVWYDNKTPAYFKQYDYPVPAAPTK